MSDWNTNITEAQTGDYVWLATNCGRVVKAYWIQGTKGYGCWSIAYADEGPIAWQPFIKPIHPFELKEE